jgi:heme/copper-type cytochrome/quinol oxidase subunit 2
LTSSLRSLAKGVNRGFCYELCGNQHYTMINIWINK